jgi:hypothetical protein
MYNLCICDFNPEAYIPATRWKALKSIFNVHLHVTHYGFYLQHVQAFLKFALSKLYARFREKLCCVQPTVSRKLQWRAKGCVQIVTHFVQCTFHISKTQTFKLRVFFPFNYD